MNHYIYRSTQNIKKLKVGITLSQNINIILIFYYETFHTSTVYYYFKQ